MRIICLLLLTACISLVSLAQNAERIRTPSGKDVILFPNGTWKYENDTVDLQSRQVYTKPVNARQSVTGKKVLYRQYFDGGIWETDIVGASEAKEYTFTLKNGFCFAMIVPEKQMMDVAVLRSAALQNARKVLPDMRVVMEEKSVVNGVRVDKVIMKGTMKDVPYTYFALYYAGSRGVVQVVTYCSTADFPSYIDKMEDFLDGFTLVAD